MSDLDLDEVRRLYKFNLDPVTAKQRDADLALIEEAMEHHSGSEWNGEMNCYLCNSLVGDGPSKWPCIVHRLAILAREALTAREDTARLNWVIANKVAFAYGGSMNGDRYAIVTVTRDGGYTREWRSLDSYRQAIDAARAPSNPKGGE